MRRWVLAVAIVFGLAACGEGRLTYDEFMEDCVGTPYGPMERGIVEASCNERWDRR